MRHKPLTVTAGLVSFIAFAVSLLTPAVAVTADDLAATVRARELAFAATMANRDLDAFSAFIAEEAVFFNGNEPLRGRDAVVASWSTFFEGEDAPFSWQPDTVVVLDSGRLALSSGPVIAADGEPRGRFNSIWRLEADGIWRVVFDKGS